MDDKKAYELEYSMWLFAMQQNSEKFLELVDENAIMVCGGFRCFGYEYAEVVKDFDCSYFNMDYFEIVNQDENSFQVHYVLTMMVHDEENSDMAGDFHVTSTWKRINDSWKLVFNMDHKIEAL